MENSPIIKIQDASIYQDKSLVLSDVSFSVHPGEFIFIIGKTGSGKSSLLKTLYADLELKNGEAEVVGFNLKKIKSKHIPKLRKKMGIVFQDFQLLTDRSVEDNLRFVLHSTGWKKKTEIKSKISEVLSKVEMQTKGFKFPHELSGGEQQRVAIARSLLNDPILLVADEPTGNLDPETSEGILNILKEISQNGKTVLMATHDKHVMEKFKTRTIKCEGGRLIEESGSLI